MGLPCRVPAIRGVLCAAGGSAAAAGTRTPGGQRDYQRETAVRESWSVLESGQTRLLSIHEVMCKMIVCNRDCFNCPYPDVPEECLSQPLTYAERRNLDWIETEIINPKTAAQKTKAAQQKAYREANKEKLAAQQKAISFIRKQKGMTRRDLAALIGVSQPTIVGWEIGTAPAAWNKLCAVLPELEEHRP